MSPPYPCFTDQNPNTGTLVTHADTIILCLCNTGLEPEVIVSACILLSHGLLFLDENVFCESQRWCWCTVSTAHASLSLVRNDTFMSLFCPLTVSWRKWHWRQVRARPRGCRGRVVIPTDAECLLTCSHSHYILCLFLIVVIRPCFNYWMCPTKNIPVLSAFTTTQLDSLSTP